MKSIYLLAVLSLLITACTPNATPLAPTAVPTSTQAAPTPKPTSTKTATLQPTSTFTPEPTDTPVPTAAPTQAVATNTPLAANNPSAAGSDESAPATRDQIAAVLAAAQTAKRDITYCTVGGIDLKMDMYFPKGKSGVTPLTVFIHGGGWSSGDKRGGTGVVDYPALLKAGFTVATLDYRLAPQYQFPAMIEDVKCAIRSLRANANQYHIDPNKIGVWGLSAGSHLSMLLAVTDKSAGFDVGQYLDQSSRVQAVVDMSGPTVIGTNMSPAFAKARDEAFGNYDLVKASPVTYITPDDPPFLIIQGDQDVVVPIASGQAQEMYDKLTAAGISAQLVVVKDGPHTLDAPNETPSRAELTKMIVDFFTAQLK